MFFRRFRKTSLYQGSIYQQQAIARGMRGVAPPVGHCVFAVCCGGRFFLLLSLGRRILMRRPFFEMDCRFSLDLITI